MTKMYQGPMPMKPCK